MEAELTAANRQLEVTDSEVGQLSAARAAEESRRREAEERELAARARAHAAESDLELQKRRDEEARRREANAREATAMVLAGEREELEGRLAEKREMREQRRRQTLERQAALASEREALSAQKAAMDPPTPVGVPTGPVVPKPTTNGAGRSAALSPIGPTRAVGPITVRDGGGSLLPVPSSPRVLPPLAVSCAMPPPAAPREGEAVGGAQQRQPLASVAPSGRRVAPIRVQAMSVTPPTKPAAVAP